MDKDESNDYKEIVFFARKVLSEDDFYKYFGDEDIPMDQYKKIDPEPEKEEEIPF